MGGSASVTQANNSNQPPVKMIRMVPSSMVLTEVSDSAKLRSAVCNIKTKGGIRIGSGFFCALEVFEDLLYFLCTNNSVIDNVYLESPAPIYCQMSDNSMFQVSKKAAINFTVEDPYNLTLVQLTHPERFKFERAKRFEFLHCLSKAKSLTGERVYTVQNPRGGESRLNLGLIRESVKPYLLYTNDQQPVSSGSPITTLDAKLLGVHKEAEPQQQSNVAIEIGAAIRLVESQNEPVATVAKRLNDEHFRDYCQSKVCCSAVSNKIAIDGDWSFYRGFAVKTQVAGKLVSGVFISTTLDAAVLKSKELVITCTFSEIEKQVVLTSTANCLRATIDTVTFVEIPQQTFFNFLESNESVTIPEMKIKDYFDTLAFGCRCKGSEKMYPASLKSLENNKLCFLNSAGISNLHGLPLFAEDGSVAAVCVHETNQITQAVKADFVIASILKQLYFP